MIRLADRFPRSSLLVLPLLVLAITACKVGDGTDDGQIAAEPLLEEELPEAGAQATCELIYECSCENPGHPDQPTCVETERLELSDSQIAAQAAGLTYDAQCAGDLLAVVEAAGCEPSFEFECGTVCAAYHGELGLDAACTIPVPLQGLWSDCAQGLLCLQGTCQDPCGIASELLDLGEACRDESGPLGECDSAAGLWCDFETEVCIALPGIGEPCYQSEICGLGATCDWSGNEALCVALPGAGEACTYACVDGYFCTGVDGVPGTCEALPGEGESCADTFACAEGTVCNEAFVCEGLPAWICE